MIEFKKGNLIQEKKLDKAEAKMFIEFLEEEKQRHKKSLNECKVKAEINWKKPILAIAYHTSAIRHIDDIEFTQKTINYLKEKFKL